MSDTPTGIGSVPWMDLTVADAKSVREFYEQVVGWRSTSVEMGGYDDWCMNEPSSGKTVAGICHARGVNRDQPAQWMIYILPPRQIGPFMSEVLTLGIPGDDKECVIIQPERDVPPGGNLY